VLGSGKDIYPSMQRYPGSIVPCDHNAQTSQTDTGIVE